jgi:hypothetical protein
MSDQNHIDGVDFYAAIQAHVLWRVRLEAYISGTGDEKLNADHVAHDHHCPLGQWINGAGGRHYGSHPRFPELQAAHACFHRQAGEVIRHADSGDDARARELLKGDYAACSQKVKAHLAKLGLEAGQG